jgi:hypothetical protein
MNGGSLRMFWKIILSEFGFVRLADFFGLYIGIKSLNPLI